MRTLFERRLLQIALVCFALFLLAMSCIGCASSTSGKLLNGAVIGSGVADYASTQQVTRSGRGREGNPLFDHGPLAQGLLKAAGMGAVIGGAWLLDERQHRVLAQVLRVVVSAVWTAAAVQNTRIGR